MSYNKNIESDPIAYQQVSVEETMVNSSPRHKKQKKRGTKEVWVHGIIENKYLVFVPSFCHQAPKTSGISYLFYTNEVTHGGGRGPGIFRMGADARKTKPWLKGWNFQPQLMIPREGRGARGWIQPPVARDLINYASIKTPNGVWELLDWRIHWCAGEGVGLEGAWKLCASLTPPPPIACSMPLFHLAVLELHSLSKQNKTKNL